MTFAFSGLNGFFLIILSLSWWGKMVADGLVDSDEFDTVVDDVLWVLSNVVGGLLCIPVKWVHGEDDTTSTKPDSKQYVMLLHFQLLGLIIFMQLLHV